MSRAAPTAASTGDAARQGPADHRRRDARVPRPPTGSGAFDGGQSNCTPASTADRAALVVVDVQDGFRSYDDLRRWSPPRAAGWSRARRSSTSRSSSTEQYPKGLQHTAPEVGLRRRRDAASRSRSSARRAPTASTSPGATRCCSAASRPTSASSQTVAGPARPRRRRPGRHRRRRLAPRRTTARSGCRALDRAGATLTTVEAALLELCERAGTPEFKDVQKVIL